MQITSHELKNVAAAEPVRVDLYSGIHKAMRACMAETLLAVGRLDPADDAEVAQAVERVMQLLGLCGAHLAHENAFVHAAMEARAPGASEAIAHEHVEHERHIAQLSAMAAYLQLAAPADRDAAAQRLYRALALFVAGNYEHMNVEETAHNAVLWAHYTDAELLALHDALVGSIPPDEMMLTARWMVPSMNAAERLALLSDIQAKAPAPAFQALLDTVRPHLDDRSWAKLARGLGLPAVAGLAIA